MTTSEHDLIDQLSVIARQCIAVTCLERFCRKYKVNCPEINQFIDHVWKVAQVHPGIWNAWALGFQEMPVTGVLGTIPDHVMAAVPEELRGDIDSLIEHVFETSASTWYGGDIPATKRELLAVLAISAIHSVEAPALLTYLRHSPAQNGWGAPLTDEEVKSWRSKG